MTKIFSVFQKGNNNLLIKVTCYDKKIYNMMLKQFKTSLYPRGRI